MAKDENEDRSGGRRKDGKRYKDGNMREDGSYATGRARPPAAGKFAVGDGRKRGRRPKGAKNFNTYFLEEAEKIVSFKFNGKEQRATQMQIAIMTGFFNANVKKENPAIGMMMDYGRRIYDSAERKISITRESDHKIIEDWKADFMHGGAAGDISDDADQPPIENDADDAAEC